MQQNKTENKTKKENKKVITKKLDPKAQREYDKLKQKYFDYYDDVKSHTHNVYDW